MLGTLWYNYRMSFLAFPGSHPLLSSAEAVAAFPQTTWRMVEGLFFANELPPAHPLDQLTGCTKIAKVILHVPTKDCTPDLVADWVKLHARGEGKLIFSLTWYGSSVKGRRFPIELKQALKRATERSIRWFESADGVSPAAIAKLDLITSGYDFTIVEDGSTCHIAVTTDVQNADRWTEIDMGRPRRNAKNGMTPPKLAAILTHLAGPVDSILDPFCGSGTFLLTAGMSGIPHIYGSDILPRIIDDAKLNLAWSRERGHIATNSDVQVTVADATKPLPLEAGSIDAIVTEGYLGTPLHGDEEQDELDREARTVRALWLDCLPQLVHALRPGGIVIATLPSYTTKHGRAQVSITQEELTNHGLTRETFQLINGSTTEEMLYARDSQSVSRKIVKWRKT